MGDREIEALLGLPFCLLFRTPCFKMDQSDLYFIAIFQTLFVSGHYSEVIMGGMSSQITSLAIVFSTVYSGVDQRKHQSSASLAIVRGIHRWPVNPPHKWPVTRKMLPFDDVIMAKRFQYWLAYWCIYHVSPGFAELNDQLLHSKDHKSCPV